jgi:hypothetical protein
MKDDARVRAEFDRYKKDAEARIAILEGDILQLKAELEEERSKKKAKNKKDEEPKPANEPE